MKAELGDDPARTGTYSFHFTLTNLGQEAKTFGLWADVFAQGTFDYNFDGEELHYIDTKTTPLAAQVTWTADGQPVYRLSRAEAQRMCKADYLDTLQPGDILPCTVTHIEPFGAFCDVGCGISALLPIDCMSVSRISSPADRVSVGQQILCAIKSRDAQGRFVLTIRELLGTWAENAAAFTVGETVVGIVRSVEEYGTFIEIAPNLAGLAESCPDLRPGQAVSVYIKNILPEKMKIKLVIVNHALSQSHRFELRYFITEGHLDHWLYSTPESHKRIETDFSVMACNPA